MKFKWIPDPEVPDAWTTDGAFFTLAVSRGGPGALRTISLKPWDACLYHHGGTVIKRRSFATRPAAMAWAKGTGWDLLAAELTRLGALAEPSRAASVRPPRHAATPPRRTP